MEVSASRWSIRALAGLETGIVGGVWMLAVFLIDAAMRGRHWYMMPNLWGSLFYGDVVFKAGPGRATLAGLALHLFLAGLFGLFYAVAVSQFVNLLRAFLAATLLSMAWYWLLYSEAALRWSPLPAGYKTLSATIAHLLFGVFLLRARSRARALAEQFEDSPRLRLQASLPEPRQPGTPASPDQL